MLSKERREERDPKRVKSSQRIVSLLQIYTNSVSGRISKHDRGGTVKEQYHTFLC